ncbi:hypothetical protein [Citrobacter sp.]|uniref:hypothetical protein n=1 Tax=Citrobacter sp. TaxID=1896336 RepID=UPI002FC709EC
MEIARNVLRHKVHYHVSKEVIARDIEAIFEMMTDLLLPVFMSDKPQTVGRQRIVKAIVDGTYKDNIALHRIICAAMLKNSPTDRIIAVYRRFEAVKNLEIGVENGTDETDFN